MQLTRSLPGYFGRPGATIPSQADTDRPYYQEALTVVD